MPDPQLPDTPQAAEAAHERLGYFLLRIRRPAGAQATEPDGVVERMGTGEKRRFASIAELVRLMNDWLK